MRTETKVSTWIKFINLPAISHDFIILHSYYFSVETARIQKESAVIDSKLEEQSRTCSELRRLQVNKTTPIFKHCYSFIIFIHPQ